MKKRERDVIYYRNLLHKDGIALLIIAIIFTIVNVLFMVQGYGEAVPIFLKSIIFIVFSIILISNKKEITKHVGSLTIVISGLMMLTSIGDGSLFGIVYFLLGIFLAIHSLSYLKKFKDNAVQINDLNEVTHKNSKFKYISLIPFVTTMILFILGIIVNQSLVGVSLFGIAILVVNAANIIICIILNHKKIKSVLIYIMLVISVIITLFGSLFFISDVRTTIRNNYYYSSEEFLIEYAKNAEEDLRDSIMLPENLKKLNIDTTKENIVTLTEFLKVISTNKILSTTVHSIDALEEEGYTCDGYVILKFKDNADINDYYLLLNEYAFSNSMNNFFDVNAFVSCSGKYEYQTNGFDSKLLTNNNTNTLINYQYYYGSSSDSIEFEIKQNETQINMEINRILIGENETQNYVMPVEEFEKMLTNTEIEDCNYQTYEYQCGDRDGCSSSYFYKYDDNIDDKVCYKVNDDVINFFNNVYKKIGYLN